jgi:ATP-dependent Lon protease
MVTVRLDMKKDCFFAEFSNLGVGNVPIADEYPEKFDRLLCGEESFDSKYLFCGVHFS